MSKWRSFSTCSVSMLRYALLNTYIVCDHVSGREEPERDATHLVLYSCQVANVVVTQWPSIREVRPDCVMRDACLLEYELVEIV